MSNNILKIHLDESYQNLPPLLQKAHQDTVHIQGTVIVKRGNWLANIIANILRMPPANANCNLNVYGSHTPLYMKWQRHFESHIMESTFSLKGAYLSESLGPIKLLLKLNTENNQLNYQVKKVSVCGMPIPKLLAPTLIAYEKEYNGLYRFHVSIGLPIIGLLISYHGDLKLIS